MSGIEVLAVVACVAAVCSAYHDGAEILQQIRAKRNARKAARLDAFSEDTTHELGISLARGQDVIQSQYDRDYKRFGVAFANGDDIAKEALKDIIIHLQAQVITNLKTQWHQDTYIDFTALQDVSDSSQDKAILVLMQLQQRIITSGPIENLRPPPLFADPASPEINSHRQQISANLNGRGYQQLSLYGKKSRISQPEHALRTQDTECHRRPTSDDYDGATFQSTLPIRVGTPTQSTPPIQYPAKYQWSSLSQAKSTYPESPSGYITELSSGSTSPTFSDGVWAPPQTYGDHRLTPQVVTTITSSGNEKAQKGHASKMKLFGKRSRAIPVTVSKTGPIRVQESEFSKPVMSSLCNEKPQGPSYTKVQRLKENPPPPPTPSSRYSMFSETTAVDSTFEPPETKPDFNPWADGSLPVALATTSIASEASCRSTLRSSGSLRRVPTPTSAAINTLPRNPKDLLPSEENKLQGFCKGAWRAQIGDKKKAMEERQRPGGMYNATRFWQCSKCKFEGRLLMLNKKTKAVDRRVLTAEGVQFRWDFLFKSHIETRDATSDFLSATFGCIFCTAEGRGTPIFGGAQMLMAHLQEHRERLPSGEVLYRMNALVGPRAAIDEDFDINIVAREGADV